MLYRGQIRHHLDSILAFLLLISGSSSLHVTGTGMSSIAQGRRTGYLNLFCIFLGCPSFFVGPELVRDGRERTSFPALGGRFRARGGGWRGPGLPNSINKNIVIAAHTAAALRSLKVVLGDDRSMSVQRRQVNVGLGPLEGSCPPKPGG